MQLMSRTILWAGISWGHTGIHSGMAPLSREIALLAPGLIRRIEWEERRAPFFTRLGRRICMSLGVRTPLPEWITFTKENPLYSESSWMLEREIAAMVSQLSSCAVMLESIDDQLFLLAKKKASWKDTRL